MKKLLMIMIIALVFGFNAFAEDTPTVTETATETDTATATETATETVTKTATRTVTCTATPTITITVTPMVRGFVYFQPTPLSGKVEVTGLMSRDLKISSITIDSLSNTLLPISIYDGNTMLRTISITNLPFTIGMSNIPVRRLIIDYGTNTGCAFYILNRWD